MKTDTYTLKLLSGKKLNVKESRVLFRHMFTGHLSEESAKGILLLLAQRGECADEILGCVQALQSLESKIRTKSTHLMDTCGTGGDNSHSLNISTLAALIIAGAGGKVAKHGNRGLSSKCGSSDLMEALGVRLEAGPVRMARAIEKHGIGYFHAPYYHPVFSRIQPLRKKLKTRTIFNLLGPLVNPLGVKRQLIGVASDSVVSIYAQVLRKKGVQHVFICHSQDGLDEISTSSKTRVIIIKRGRLSSMFINPQKLGFKKAHKKDYTGGSIQRNKALALKLLKNKLKGPLRDMIILNAAAGLVVAGKTGSIQKGIKLAEESLSSGNAYRALKGLRKVTHSS